MEQIQQTAMCSHTTGLLRHFSHEFLYRLTTLEGKKTDLHMQRLKNTLGVSKYLHYHFILSIMFDLGRSSITRTLLFFTLVRKDDFSLLRLILMAFFYPYFNISR